MATLASPASPAGVMPRVGLKTKILYATGAASTSMKQKIIGTFLLIYYNQVIGLTPAMVGTAIMIAMIFDAVIDPVIGQWSDNFRSRWGRRHPFMYVAALPTAIGFYMLWNPPAGLSDMQIFSYLLGCLLIVRLFDTFFEVPSTALVPELAKGYEERTTLFSLRTGFAISGGYLIILAAYQIFMPQQANGSGGITDRAGYMAYSIMASILIFATILLSSFGTHHLIPWLDKAPKKHDSVRKAAHVVLQTVGTPAFIILTVSGMLYSVAIGVRHAVEIYFYLYFWNFNQAQISILTLVSVPAVFLGVTLAPLAAKAIGKKKAAVTALSLALVATSTPPLLRVLGVLPGNADTSIFSLILIETVFTQTMSVIHSVLAASMLADVVEEAAVKTGQRSEGLILSAENLFKKIVSGVGVFAGGLVLSLSGFPHNAKLTGVSDTILKQFGIAYLPIFAAPFVGAIFLLTLFRIDKARHERNVVALNRAAARTAEAVDQEMES